MKNKKNTCKIISFIGNNNVGKTSIILILTKIIKNKILIIDCDFKFKEIQNILNSKKIENPKICKIKNNIYLYNNFINIYNKKIFYKEINKLKNKFDLIIFDNNYNNFFYDEILKVSEKIFLIIDPEKNELIKTKKLYKNILYNNNLKNKIKIILNKKYLFSINKIFIEKLFEIKIYKIIKLSLFIKLIKNRYKIINKFFYYKYKNLLNKKEYKWKK